MSLQSIAARARIEGIRALQQTVDRLRRPIRPPSSADLYLVRGSSPHRADASVWWSLDNPEASDADRLDAADCRDADPLDAEEASAHAPADDRNITKSLEHIAATIDRLSAQLDAYHRERAEHLDAIEFLLKEVVLGGAASAPRSVVFGGVLDSDAIEAPAADITILADHLPLEVDTAVEVRSRFHDRWIYGFAIAEAIEMGAGPCRYRLTRRSDGIPLPILFDACDVRAAAPAFERNPVD
jgi:hypothetical protein